MRSIGKSVVIDEPEFERRKPISVTRSDLWLGTQLAGDNLERIADIIKWSGISKMVDK
jgi:hypothetical protein